MVVCVLSKISGSSLVTVCVMSKDICTQYCVSVCHKVPVPSQLDILMSRMKQLVTKKQITRISKLTEYTELVESHPDTHYIWTKFNGEDTIL